VGDLNRYQLLIRVFTGISQRDNRERTDGMKNPITLYAVMAVVVMGGGGTAFAQVPSAGDMQQRLDQEMANAKRSATESTSNVRQGAGNVKSEAERKMEETAAQHKSQAEAKMTEEIEKAKQKSQGMGR
jgi:hypothetical protein